MVCAGWLRHLARTAPDADVWVDCHSPGLSQLLLGDLHPRVRFVDTLWRMSWAAPDDPAAAAEFVAGAVRRAGTVAAMDAGPRVLLGADVLHVVGGGYVNTIWPRHYGLVAGIVEAARISGARTGITGHGLLPLGAGADEVVRGLAAELTVCDVRDQPSQQLLAGVSGPRLSATGDDLLLAFSRALFDTRKSPDVIVAAQSDMLDHPLDRLTDLIGRVLEAWEVEPHRWGGSSRSHRPTGRPTTRWSRGCPGCASTRSWRCGSRGCRRDPASAGCRPASTRTCLPPRRAAGVWP